MVFFIFHLIECIVCVVSSQIFCNGNCIYIDKYHSFCHHDSFILKLLTISENKKTQTKKTENWILTSIRIFDGNSLTKSGNSFEQKWGNANRKWRNSEQKWRNSVQLYGNTDYKWGTLTKNILN